MMKLLILDLDETLIYATDETVSGAKEDFCVGSYAVYRRPGLEEFLDLCFRYFKVAVWTSSSKSYAEEVVGEVFKGRTLEFVFSRGRCVRSFDHELLEPIWIKDLKKVKRKGYSLQDIIVVDDTPAKLRRNYGNLVRIRPFEGDYEDQELKYLSRYLLDLREAKNIRRIEKRGWRNKYKNS